MKSGNKNKGAAHNRFVHGMTGTSVYKSWSGMKSRCFQPRNNSYKDWGGRGITVCERWMTFENFFSDMGEKPRGWTLERIDVDGNYEPSNCVWANRTVQSRNRRYTKLSLDAAASIRNDRIVGATYQELSGKYGISISHAHRIVSMESWA